MFIVHLYIEVQDFYKRRYGGNRRQKHIFWGSTKNFCEHQEQIKTTGAEGKKEGRQTVSQRLLRARRFSFARRIFSGSNWIPPRWAGIIFFQKKLGQWKIGPFLVSRWWQLKHFFMFIPKFGEENHPFFGPFNLFQMGWVNQPPTKTYLHQIWSDQFPPGRSRTAGSTKFLTLLTRKVIYTQLPVLGDI